MTAVVPRREFRRCTAEVVVAPVLQLASAAPARVEWSAVGDATAYQLEEAAEPDFVGPIRWVVDPVTDGLGHDLALGPDRDRYYRVRGSADGQAGPWSNTILIAGGPSLPSYALDAPEDYLALGRAEILAIHRALLRCAATRGDASVLLSLPDHYRDADACAHRDALLHALDVPAAGPARVPPLAGEPEVVAYGGLYHPWVLRSLLDDVGSAARLPVDGAVAGLIARRTLSRGAWIAPANDPLVGVLGLWPEPDAALALAAHQAQVNRLVVAPRGVLNLSAMTLSLDGALRELTALRTLILVRRLVRREAPPHVFENNGAQLRTRIRDDFTRTLSRLWRAGGLAGRTATEAFEIVTDGRNNDRRGVEAGRLVVELHFAPTVPLSFLSVRLVEGSQGGAFVEVR